MRSKRSVPGSPHSTSSSCGSTQRRRESRTRARLRAAGDAEAAAGELAAAHHALVEMGALGLAEVVERERARVPSS